MSITVLGSVAFDEIITPSGESGKIVGGSATHFAYAASKFVPVNIVSIVGNDFPKQEIEMFKQHNINTLGLEVDETQKTFFWKGKYHDDMNTRDTITTELNVFEHYQTNIPKNLLEPDYLMLANIVPANQLKLLSQLKAKPKFIVLDSMNLWIDIAQEQLIETIKQADLLMLNDGEALQLTGETSLTLAAKKMMDIGIDSIVIKKGEHGALLFHHNDIFAVPGFPLTKVTDPTGAGDCFAGGFLGYLAKHGNLNFDYLKQAVIVGSAVASLCVEDFGTNKLKNTTQEELHQRIKAFMNLTAFDKKII